MKRQSAIPGVIAPTLLLALALTGCASAPPAATGSGGAAEERPVVQADPWENWNRKVFAFNDGIDRAVVKPVTQAYRAVVPQLIRTGVNNVLGNLYDINSTANQFLQGKLQYGLEMGMRVIVNTFFGLGGLLDPATEASLVKRPEDFGQTLGRWGVASGPYVVLPLFGPSTVRDGAALVVDRQLSPSQLAGDGSASYGVFAVEVVNARSELLATTDLLDQVALDRYSFIRDAYLARRLDQVYDGSPPLAPMDTGAEDAAPPAAGASAPAAVAPQGVATPQAPK